MPPPPPPLPPWPILTPSLCLGRVCHPSPYRPCFTQKGGGGLPNRLRRRGGGGGKRGAAKVLGGEGLSLTGAHMGGWHARGARRGVGARPIRHNVSETIDEGSGGGSMRGVTSRSGGTFGSSSAPDMHRRLVGRVHAVPAWRCPGQRGGSYAGHCFSLWQKAPVDTTSVDCRPHVARGSWCVSDKTARPCCMALRLYCRPSTSWRPILPHNQTKSDAFDWHCSVPPHLLHLAPSSYSFPSALLVPPWLCLQSVPRPSLLCIVVTAPGQLLRLVSLLRR